MIHFTNYYGEVNDVNNHIRLAGNRTRNVRLEV